MHQPSPEADRDATLFRPLERPGIGFYIVVLLLLSIVAWAFRAYIHQVVNGLGVTGMNRPVFWGIYITNFIFFIGISHAGTLISAILRVTKAGWRRPITRAAEAITVFALMVGPINVLIDLGRPDRLLHVFQFGRFQSPLLWDVVAIGTYFTGSMIYLYLPLIPDIAEVRDRLDIRSRRRRFYELLSLGWTGTEEQKRRLNRAIAIMAVIIIPIAISVHTVVSWVLAMTIQPMWHSAIFGPYVVMGAIYSGIASIIIGMALLRKFFHLEDYLKPVHFSNLGVLLGAFTMLWLYFTLSEHLTVFYGDEPSEMAVFTAKVWGRYYGLFWITVIITFVIPIFILGIR
ncbi:MAG: NrfD/PsrC family molybdoenzyme membrane anchor subunit, partial [Dehalococcoidia bacterium]